MLEGARKFTFPADLLEGSPESVLVCIPIPVLPYLRRFFAQMQSSYIWKSSDDFERAYPVFSGIEAQMTSSCVSGITESIDRLYRLLDTTLNGTQYTDNAGIISPELPSVPPASASATNAMRAHIGRIWKLLENTTNGATAATGEGVDGAPALDDNQSTRAVIRAKADEIKQAIVDGNTDVEQLLDDVAQLVILLG